MEIGALSDNLAIKEEKKASLLLGQHFASTSNSNECIGIYS